MKTFRWCTYFCLDIVLEIKHNTNFQFRCAIHICLILCSVDAPVLIVLWASTAITTNCLLAIGFLCLMKHSNRKLYEPCPQIIRDAEFQWVIFCRNTTQHYVAYTSWLPILSVHLGMSYTCSVFFLTERNNDSGRCIRWYSVTCASVADPSFRNEKIIENDCRPWSPLPRFLFHRYLIWK